MSEAEDTCDRLWRKQRRLEARLTEHGGKPKWMRVRTFDHIYERICTVEEARNREFLMGAARLLGRLGGSHLAVVSLDAVMDLARTFDQQEQAAGEQDQVTP